MLSSVHVGCGERGSSGEEDWEDGEAVGSLAQEARARAARRNNETLPTREEAAGSRDGRVKVE